MAPDKQSPAYLAGPAVPRGGLFLHGLSAQVIFSVIIAYDEFQTLQNGVADHCHAGVWPLLYFGQLFERHGVPPCGVRITNKVLVLRTDGKWGRWFAATK